MPPGFGLADILLMTCLDWAVAYKITLPLILDDYRRRVAGRDAYARACAVNFDRNAKE
jgi:glutathione S-transferase